MIRTIKGKNTPSPIIPDLRPVDLEDVNGNISTTYEEFDFKSLNYGTIYDWLPSELMASGVQTSAITVNSSMNVNSFEDVQSFKSKLMDDDFMFGSQTSEPVTSDSPVTPVNN